MRFQNDFILAGVYNIIVMIIAHLQKYIWKADIKFGNMDSKFNAPNVNCFFKHTFFSGSNLLYKYIVLK